MVLQLATSLSKPKARGLRPMCRAAAPRARSLPPPVGLVLPGVAVYGQGGSPVESGLLTVVAPSKQAQKRASD